MLTAGTPEKKGRILEAAIRLIRERGFGGTTVDLVCSEAEVTKGAFFHYFGSKEDMAESALEAWMCGWKAHLASASFDEIADPLDRVNALFDLMERAYLEAATLNGCLVGTIAQETAPLNQRLGSLCQVHLDDWLAHTTKLLEDARAAKPVTRDFDPRELAMHMMCIVQGSLLVSKTYRDSSCATNSIVHSRAYVNSFFAQGNTQ